MTNNNKFESAKRYLADQLSAASDRYSTKTKKWVLALFGIACAILCMVNVITPFANPKKLKINSSSSIPMVMPPQVNDPILSKEEHQMLEGFIQTLDSLKRTDKQTYENAIRGREGMIDSILFLLRYSGEALLNK